MSPLRSLIQHTKHHRPQIIIASVYSVINKIFDIAPEILIGMAIDVVVSKEQSFLANFGVIDPWHQILTLGFLTLFIWVGESFFEYLLLLAWRGLAQTIQHEIRMDTYKHVQQLDLSYFEDKSTGNLVSILNDDVNQLERFLDGGVNNLLQTFVAVIGVGAIFFILSPQIASIAFLPIPLILMGSFYFQKKATPLYKEVRDRVGDLSARLNNNISGIMTIKSFTSENREAAALDKESRNYMAANKKAIAVSSAYIPIIRMAILSGFLATFILGGWKVLQGDLAVGSYGVLVFLTQRLLWPLTRLAESVDLYERAMASTRRILDLLHTQIKSTDGNISSNKIQGEFIFKDVNFTYSTGPQILKNLNLNIEAGKTTAFVGSTGSGKSSLVKLLLKLYQAQSGEVLLDGQNLSHYKSHNLRSHIGLVSQDVFLFHGSVRENILYGNPKASDSELLNAAQLSEAHDFIMELPKGYDTLIGERGQKLSGGQRQRLSIARAILKNPDVMILDEATSAVDNETEAAIQRSMGIISKDRTTIVIAHRLSTVVNAHRIYVLEKGAIAEEGTHQELRQKQSIYNHLWQVQTGQNQL